MSSGWIGVDLDGTLAEYDGWKGGNHIGAPVPSMVNRVKAWLREGKDVRIFTARVHQYNPAREESSAAIDVWSMEQFGLKLPQTAEKDFMMVELWDDRCKQVVLNTGISVEEQRDLFRKALGEILSMSFLPGPASSEQAIAAFRIAAGALEDAEKCTFSPPLVFNDEQLRLITYLKSVGYGYAKFAESVEKYGRCTERQETAMRKMVRDITERREWFSNRSSGRVNRVSPPQQTMQEADPMIYDKGGITGYSFGGPSGGEVFYDENGEETNPPDDYRD
jgi:hypothetical protein